jgi:arsenate reductase
MSSPTRVLFVCMQNAGRSQIATALANHVHADLVDARSAGLNPDTNISAVTAQVLAARGIDITGNVPRMLMNADLEDADVVITLIRDVEIEVPEGVREETWVLPDPASWGPQHIEALVDHISARIDDLVTRLMK